MRLQRRMSVVIGSIIGGFAVAVSAWAASGAAASAPAASSAPSRSAATGVPVSPAVTNDGLQPGVEGSGEWIDVYEPVDLSGELILHTTAGAWVTLTDEGAVIATLTPETVTVPTSWRLIPVSDRFQLATVALTDSRPTCLSVFADGVGLEFCDAGRSGQLLKVETGPTVSSGMPVEIISDDGYLAVTERGSLATTGERSATLLMSAAAVPQA